MASISYSISLGQTLEQVTVGANAPSGGSGTVELRMDQTATAIADGSVPGGTRMMKKGEIHQMLVTLVEQLIKDTSLAQ
jgi:hypothetical protein